MSTDVIAGPRQNDSTAPALTGQSDQIFMRPVTVTPEARRLARILGIRQSEYICQRLIDAENAVEKLAARVEKLEARKKS
jgi:hypothetical protein